MNLDCASTSHHHVMQSTPLPKLDFPKFDGDNPCLWKDQCEQYFEVYAINDILKPRFAALNFVGGCGSLIAISWVEGSVSVLACTFWCYVQTLWSWSVQLHTKWLDHLKQSGTVAAYFETFQALAHHILLYNNSYDDVYFVTRFLGGIKEEIHSPIALHRPKNLEEAYSLDLL